MIFYMICWRTMKTPRLTGAVNMTNDLLLFRNFESGLIPSTLRIYSWRPNCVSLGYAQKKDRWIDEAKAKQLAWDVVVRPTGGGIVFHNEAEVTYSLVTEIDNPLLPKRLVPAYKKISEAVVWALKHLGIDAVIGKPNKESPSTPLGASRKTNTGLCFSYPAEYEIVVGGKKIVGSAQKRGKRAMLQQGSIFMRQPPREILSVLKNPCAEHNAVSVEEMLGREVGFEELSEALFCGFKEKLGVCFEI